MQKHYCSAKVRFSLLTTICLIVLTGLLPVADTLAQGGRVVFSTRNAFARIPTVLSDTDPGDDVFVRANLEDAILSTSWLRYIKPVGQGDSFRVGTGLAIWDYLDEDDLDTLLLMSRGEYWISLGPSRQWQLRVGGDVGQSWRENERRFFRTRTDASIHYKHSRNYQVWSRLVFADYDYNDEVLSGFDQQRLSLITSNRWRPTGDYRNEIEGRVVLTKATAEEKRFGYKQFSTSVNGSVDVGGPVDIIGRTKFSRQTFADNFSATENMRRRDTRLEIDSGLRIHLPGNVNLIARAGWIDNDSNIEGRDFSGATGWVGMEYRSNGYW